MVRNWYFIIILVLQEGLSLEKSSLFFEIFDMRHRYEKILMFYDDGGYPL
jgi:hypothetical protein